MMRANRAGFTLVELLIVAVLGGVVLGAAYQALIVQERASRTTGEMIRSQDALRAAIGILEAELREVATMGGGAIGASDIISATSEEIVFRAQRTVAFVCAVLASDKRLSLWSPSPFDAVTGGEPILIFNEGGSSGQGDDTWLIATTKSPGASTDACASNPATGTAEQRIQVADLDGNDVGTDFLSEVTTGAPIRVLQRVAYGLYAFDDRWALGREGADGQVQPIIVGLDEPGSGLTFTYLDENGLELTGTPVDPTAIAAIDITARAAPRAGAPAVELSTSIFLRNNNGGGT